MGAFGPALFSDDLAMDVRGTYRVLLEDRVADDDAVVRVMERFAASVADHDDEPIVVLALAVTAWKLGRLAPEFRDRAVGLLEAGRGVERWEDDPKLLRGRVVALERVRAQLRAEQPARKRVRRPPRHTTSLVPGEVLALQLREGDYLALRVMRHDESRRWVAPVVQILDWRGDHQPTAREVQGCGDLEPRPRVAGEANRWWSTRSPCFGRRGHDYSDFGLVKIGAIAIRPGDDVASWGSYGGWEGLVAQLRTWAAYD